MTDAVETMAWTGEVPWHGMGNKVHNKMTPDEMRVASQTDWGVLKDEVYRKNKAGVFVKIKGEYCLTRDSDEQILDMVGDKYKPVQNEKAFAFFKEFCDEGKMTMETAGSLWNGRYVWVLARLGKDFKVGKTDEVRPYLLLCSPHMFGRSLLIQYTPIRVVCWNTLCMAVGANIGGKGGNTFKMPHSQDFDKAKDKAKVALGLALEQTDKFKQAVELLAKKKATPELVDEYFMRVLKIDPKAAADDAKKGKKAERSTVLPKFRAAIERAPGAQLTSAKGTWWGALNAITYVYDHDTGKDRQTALKNVWIGHLSNVKNHALELALEYAK